jgi:hypothetical protein
MPNAKPVWEEMHGPFSNLHASVPDEEQECDLDVGILGCGMDRECIPSSGSKRGGVCRAQAKQNSRELQNGNTTTPFESIAQDFFQDLCQDQQSMVYCDCTKFDSVTLHGEISCTYPCDDNDMTFCGTSTYNFKFENGSLTASACLEASTEQLCYLADLSMEKCLSATMNGCDCSCEFTSTVCSSDSNSTMSISCPNNVSTDGCNGIEDLFGNKVPACDGPPQSPITTVPPAGPPNPGAPVAVQMDKPNAGAPVAVKPDEPSASPGSSTSPPTTSSATVHVSSLFQMAAVVTTMAVAVIYCWV